MAVNLSPVGGVAAQFFDNSGQVLTGGKLYSYLAGTTTPAITYTTSTGLTAQPNPIVLNAAGRVSDSGEIWLTDGISYKFVLKDQNDVLIATYDNVVGINSNFINFTGQEETQTATQGQTVFTLTTLNYQPGTNNLLVFVNGSKQVPVDNFIESSSTVVTFLSGLNVGDVVDFSTATPINTTTVTAGSVAFTGFKGQIGNVQNLADDDGADWIGFLPAGTAAVARSAQDKMRQTVSFKDFGAIGNNIVNDTVAMQAAIDGVSAGTIIDGENLTYLATQLNVNKAVIIQNCIIHMKNAASVTTTQACFNVTANNVKLLNCGSSVVTAELGNITNAVGVLADGVTNLYIDSGTYTGSKSALGNYGVLHIINSNQPKVTNTIVKQSFGDGIYFFTCNTPEALSNTCDTNGGSGVTADSCTGALISYNYIVSSGQSGLACNSTNSIVSFNYVKNPATNGITSGELASSSVEIVSNIVEGALQTPGVSAKYAGILVQAANGSKVLNNIIKAPKSGVVTCDGISFVNSPVSFQCDGNQIAAQTGAGISIIDTANACGGFITNNTIDQPQFSGIDVLGCKRMFIDGNLITQANRANDASGMGITINTNATSPDWLKITNNIILDTTPRQRYAIYFQSTMSTSTMATIRGNTIRGWVTNAYVGNRSCLYDVANNDWDGTSKNGLVTLTNGGTTTTVTTGQCVLNTFPTLSLGNAASATLNPVYRVSTVANGSFTITHTAGTASAEQLQWVIR
jgi:hypothetical protein